jgi:hypothetical protein
MNIAVATDKQLASIVRRGLQGLELDDDEANQFFALMGQFLNTWSVLFDLHTEGHLPNTQWTVIKKDIISLLTPPGGKSFWEKSGRKGIQTRFEIAVDEILASDESSYEFV